MQARSAAIQNRKKWCYYNGSNSMIDRERERKRERFQYKETHYKQLDGVAMGSPVSPVIADIFMEDFEDRAFAAYLAADLPCV